MSYKDIKAGWDREPESEKRKIKRTVGGYLVLLFLSVAAAVFCGYMFCTTSGLQCRGF